MYLTFFLLFFSQLVDPEHPPINPEVERHLELLEEYHEIYNNHEDDVAHPPIVEAVDLHVAAPVVEDVHLHVADPVAEDLDLHVAAPPVLHDVGAVVMDDVHLPPAQDVAEDEDVGAVVMDDVHLPPAQDVADDDEIFGKFLFNLDNLNF